MMIIYGVITLVTMSLLICPLPLSSQPTPLGEEVTEVVGVEDAAPTLLEDMTLLSKSLSHLMGILVFSARSVGDQIVLL